MEFFTACLWKFCLIDGILAFLDENSTRIYIMNMLNVQRHKIQML